MPPPTRTSDPFNLSIQLRSNFTHSASGCLSPDQSAQMHTDSGHTKTFRIALTGGPGGGKTTAAGSLRDASTPIPVAVVPETATVLFSGGFPRSAVPEAKRFAQT